MGEAQLAVSELVTNVVLHARTEMVVRVELTPSGVRVGVQDGDPKPPLSTLDVLAAAPAGASRPRAGAGDQGLGTVMVSGRGLGLVATLSREWGVRVLPDGKETWFCLDAGTRPGAQDDRGDAAELFEQWAAFDAGTSATAGGAPGGPAGGDDVAAALGLVTTVALEVPVQPMLAAEARVEDLVRDLRLALLHGQAVGGGGEGAVDEEELAVARRLDEAVRRFAEGRRQLRQQVMQAAAEGRERIRLSVRLPAADADAAQLYREALDAADELSRRGRLLLAGSLVEHAELRHAYLDEIVRQLRGHP